MTKKRKKSSGQQQTRNHFLQIHPFFAKTFFSQGRPQQKSFFPTSFFWSEAAADRESKRRSRMERRERREKRSVRKKSRREEERGGALPSFSSLSPSLLSAFIAIFCGHYFSNSCFSDEGKRGRRGERRGQGGGEGFNSISRFASTGGLSTTHYCHVLFNETS